MNFIAMRNLLFYTLLLLSLVACQSEKTDVALGEKLSFNADWQFSKTVSDSPISTLSVQSDKFDWEAVTLPHTANIEPLVIKGNQWQGDAYYRKFFTLAASDSNKHIALKFEAAMQVAEVYLNGKLLQTNLGGYLPFYVDLSGQVKFEEENCVVVKLNNDDNAQIGPGKPIADLDFNIFSGIYRNVWLIKKNLVHVSDPIQANQIAGGGVFVTYSGVSAQKATVRVQVDVQNELDIPQATTLQLELAYAGKPVANQSSEVLEIPAKSSSVFDLAFTIDKPQLWSPDVPNLHQLVTRVLVDNQLTDVDSISIGIRSIEFTTEKGFLINGDSLKLRGTNRHQEYPYIGYALSDNANYRDAWKIKEAGFNFVRLSHYPQSNAFLQACDELGILVMDAVPGWQFFGDSIFQDNVIADVRNMVRRDRNHPSIILWEASLNESAMTVQFMQRAHDAVHEEYPTPNVYTCGWLNEVYDVFIPARQHAKPPLYWNGFDAGKPVLIAEYGDWEYYAQNAGLSQKLYQNLSEEERTSRQLRGQGQKRLTQQALNFQEAHNSNLQGTSVGDANWLMFDYNRGYDPTLETSGIMDIFRLPKFAYYFYASQPTAGTSAIPHFTKPMVKIANFYNDPSFTDIKVYSNCDEVELLLNNVVVEKRKPDADIYSTHLAHPPFTFQLGAFVPGELIARAFQDGEVVATDTVSTAEQPAALKISIDESGKAPARNDVLFLYAKIVDRKGRLVSGAQHNIKFTIQGSAELVGNNPIDAEAGIATVLLKTGLVAGKISVTAHVDGLAPATLQIQIP